MPKNYSRNEIEEMKDFTREKLFIEHVLPEIVKQEGRDRRLTSVLLGVATGLIIGRVYSYFSKRKKKNRRSLEECGERK